jgi:AcrR family transcriptional regulator
MPYPAKINREKILKHGLRIVEKDGLEALSLRAIARRLKVAVNALYHYFPDRKALESAIAAEGYRVLRSSLAETSSGAHAAARLQAFCKRYLRFARSHRRLFELMSRKRPPKSELAAIGAELTSLMAEMRGSKPGKDCAAEKAFMVQAMLQGIIAAEQQTRSSIPASYIDFAIARVISGITRTPRMKKHSLKSRMR